MSSVKLQTILNNMPDGYSYYKLLYDKNNKPCDFVFLEVNKRFEELIGISRQMVIGKPFNQVFSHINSSEQLIKDFYDVALNGGTKKHEAYIPDLKKWYSITAFSSYKDYFSVIFHDITNIKQTQNLLYKEKERLRITLHSIGDAVITTDEKGIVTLLNKVAEDLTGWKMDEAVGKPLERVFNIINEKTKAPCENPVEKVLREGRVVELANHTVLISKNGDTKSIADSGAPIKDKDGKIFGVILVFRDVTDKRKKEKEIIYLSYHDKLTGLYNRAYFEKKCDEINKNKYMPISMIIGDMNALKLTNDVFGHIEGDRLIIEIAKIVKACCREKDIAVRWGGDEFAIIMPNTKVRYAEQVCKKIKDMCSQVTTLKIKPSISLGVALKESIEEKFDILLKRAENRMYHQKLVDSKSIRTNLISSLAKTLYEKSTETKEHAERIRELSIKLGKELNISQAELDDLELLSLLHDIGKISVSDNVLEKPGELSEAEWDEIKKHPEIGYRIADSTTELAHIAYYILSHHEKWDGSGYPQRLKEKEIPLLSRIISISDAYEAMTTKRPFKKLMTKNEAIDEIRRCSGTHFDPYIVDVFINKVINID